MVVSFTVVATIHLNVIKTYGKKLDVWQKAQALLVL